MLFFSETVITVILIFTCIMDSSFSNLILFSPHSFLHCENTFPTFAWDAVCRSRKTVCWSIGALNARCVSARRSQNGVFRMRPFGGGGGRMNSRCRFLRVKSWWASYGTVKESC
jgi:hypothetical protein